MKSITMAWHKQINVLLVLSIIASFFILPATTPAKAGILSTIYCKLGPVLKIAGRIGGAVAGASLAAGFVPPLGMIAGAIGGWIIGGVITDYATGSLTNLAMLGGGVAGAMALGPGVVGTVGGFLLGALVGRIGMGVLRSADKKITGGLLLQKGSAGAGQSLAPSGVTVTSGVTGAVTVNAQTPTTTAVSADQQAKEVQAKYQTAYQNYINATQGGDAKNINAAHKAYQEAYREYQTVIGTTPK